MALDIARHSAQSSQLEKVLEHVFVGELLRCLWRRQIRDVELLRGEVDCAGYDLALECNGTLRHIQLKASHTRGKAREVKVNRRLWEKPNGCVIWLRFDPGSLDISEYFWFGEPPGRGMRKLEERSARHTKGNRLGEKLVRPRIQLIGIAEFDRLVRIDDVAERLFGPSVDAVVAPRSRQAGLATER